MSLPKQSTQKWTCASNPLQLGVTDLKTPPTLRNLIPASQSLVTCVKIIDKTGLLLMDHNVQTQSALASLRYNLRG